jgi:ribosome-binding protein aMBF1 (putative translation factor)
MRQSLTERVALAIRVEMVRRGMKTSALAASIDESYLWLQRRLTGTTPFLLEDVQRIADALGVQLTHLVGEDVAA